MNAFQKVARNKKILCYVAAAILRSTALAAGTMIFSPLPVSAVGWSGRVRPRPLSEAEPAEAKGCGRELRSIEQFRRAGREARLATTI